MLKSIIIGATAALALTATAASAATVVNGSFEDGPALIGSWDILEGPNPIPGWYAQPNIEIQTQPTIGLQAQDGVRYAELDTNQDARIYQDIALDAGTYLLSFWYSPRVDASPTNTNDMVYEISAGTTAYIAEIITLAPNGDFLHGEWTNVQAEFTLDTDETIQLSFAATGGSFFDGCGNCGALLDNVSIAAVPLPAGGLLLLSALFGAGALRRRQKTA
jgi:hypothetical protein